jgi:hypothetical protein
MHQKPLLYSRTREDIRTYWRKSSPVKLQWLETQMEFFRQAMLDKAKRISGKLLRGDI